MRAGVRSEQGTTRSPSPPGERPLVRASQAVPPITLRGYKILKMKNVTNSRAPLNKSVETMRTLRSCIVAIPQKPGRSASRLVPLTVYLEVVRGVHATAPSTPVQGKNIITHIAADSPPVGNAKRSANARRGRKTRLREVDPARSEPPGASAQYLSSSPTIRRFWAAAHRVSTDMRPKKKNERRRRGVCKDAPQRRRRIAYI